ncbi:MAG: amidohydrolase family protein [Verrucomicrobia bacterium]|nr:amidohydrolase family protein [Verrucomicrobiota bacterium]
MVWVVASNLILRGDDSATHQQETEEEKASWNVNHIQGPGFEQIIDTREGTWMNLDVSPDGKHVAFDLLGDLYMMPIEGVNDKNAQSLIHLTEGIAWDMQPRFSPDGQHLVFTSDRTGKNEKGGDNIWTLHIATGELNQITQETFRLFNNPNWSPDGEYIVARKHFTSRRSLGAGEMWLFHRSGVNGGAHAGVQLTSKPTDQKDVNEPIFSIDGKHLYYSEDASPGSSFEYDKDSNGQIYVVRQLDLETGKTLNLINGPGGACRPTPSPDGKTLAFVRRVDGKSGLHVFDIESGAIQLLYDNLERDMQETWAIHGVYPAFAWTPDGGSIVFWARGKIWRLNVADTSLHEIPFRIRDTRQVAEPVRFPVNVAPGKFPVRMLRWVRVSPQGDKVVYQALGHIYIKNLPDGEPTRLTSQNDHFEFHPSFSRDGQYLVYTTWNDKRLGQIRVTSLSKKDDHENRVITNKPGHYINPVFSPDGSKVVFQRTGGGWLTSPLWSRDQGIYAIASQGGQPVKITESGSNPQFGISNERVFLQKTASDPNADNRKLVSISMEGKEERTHFTSTWATDYQVSPDGKWIGFVERFHVYVAPFVQTGKTITLGPDQKGLPMFKASETAGDWIQFSGPDSNLYWSLGSDLYSLPVSLEQMTASDEDTLPEPKIKNISFETEHDKPSGTLALTGGRMLSMVHPFIEENTTLIIQENRIADIGPDGKVAIPENAHVLSLEGRLVMPGLIDTHAHGQQAASGIIPQQNWVDYARLGFGVTTVHDPSNDTQSIFAASEMTKAGLITAPRTFSTGRILYGATGSYKAEIDSLDDAKFHLERMKAVGAFSVKSYNQPRRDQRQQIIQAAREMGMLVVPEGGATFMHNLTMIVDGHTGIEHTVPVEMIYGDVLDLWRGTEVGYTPTLNVAYGGLGGENYWYDVDEVWRNDRVMAFNPPHKVIPRARRRTTAPIEDYNHIRQARITKKLIDQGGLVQAGGHGQLNGICTHWELWSFVQGGMTPFEALRSGTLHGAKYLGMDHDLGTIEVGKLADLIIFEESADPSIDIRQSQNIEWVIANGRLYDAKTMNQKGNHSLDRHPFYWEQSPLAAGLMMQDPATCAGCQRGAQQH